MAIVKAYGASGTLYEYHVGLIDGGWNKVPVNYMFGRLDIGGWYIPYVGESGNAQTRFCPHERWDEAVRIYKATHILTHVGSSVLEMRQKEERDLIVALNPPMNVQHKNLGALGLAATGTHGLLNLGALDLHKKK